MLILYVTDSASFMLNLEKNYNYDIVIKYVE